MIFYLSDSDDVDLDNDSEDVDNLESAVNEAKEEEQISNYNVGDFVIVTFEKKTFLVVIHQHLIKAPK
jgi:hypothetical protein